MKPIVDAYAYAPLRCELLGRPQMIKAVYLVRKRPIERARDTLICDRLSNNTLPCRTKNCNLFSQR